MENKISEKRLNKYFEITEKAFAEIKKNIIKRKEKQAEEIIKMVENYLSDAKHFEKNKKIVDAFAALNYAHGWIDAGVRLNIFAVNDRNLFTIK